MKRAKCYALTWAEETANTGVAYAPDDAPLAYELSEQMENENQLPFSLELREGEAQDFLANSLAWPLMSLKMKNLIESKLTGEEGIDWIKVNVKDRGENREYFVPRFRERLDVLDMSETTFVDGTDHIIKPCFSLSKIQCYSLFHKPTQSWRVTGSLYVNESLKQAIEEHKLSGVAFERTSVTQ